MQRFNQVNQTIEAMCPHQVANSLDKRSAASAKRRVMSCSTVVALLQHFEAQLELFCSTVAPSLLAGRQRQNLDGSSYFSLFQYEFAERDITQRIETIDCFFALMKELLF